MFGDGRRREASPERDCQGPLRSERRRAEWIGGEVENSSFRSPTRQQRGRCLRLGSTAATQRGPTPKVERIVSRSDELAFDSPFRRTPRAGLECRRGLWVRTGEREQCAPGVAYGRAAAGAAPWAHPSRITTRGSCSRSARQLFRVRLTDSSIESRREIPERPSTKGVVVRRPGRAPAPRSDVCRRQRWLHGAEDPTRRAVCRSTTQDADQPGDSGPLVTRRQRAQSHRGGAERAPKAIGGPPQVESGQHEPRDPTAITASSG